MYGAQPKMKSKLLYHSYFFHKMVWAHPRNFPAQANTLGMGYILFTGLQIHFNLKTCVYVDSGIPMINEICSEKGYGLQAQNM